MGKLPHCSPASSVTKQGFWNMETSLEFKSSSKKQVKVLANFTRQSQALSHWLFFASFTAASLK